MNHHGGPTRTPSARACRSPARRWRRPARRPRRRGYVLIWVALLFVVFFGLLGIVIDFGMLASQQRNVQNVADSAALAAARDLLGGYSVTTARQTAIDFITTINGLSEPPPENIRIPPTTGPYAGMTGYVEVVLQQPSSTYFIQAVPGISGQHVIAARAVSGYEAVSGGEGVTALRPDKTGLVLNGGGRLSVKGRIVVNSEGKGYDQNGVAVNTAKNFDGATSSQRNDNNGTGGVFALDFNIVGGVTNPDFFYPYNAGDPSPLHARQLPEPDPLINLPIPTVALGVDNRSRGTVRVTNNTRAVSDPSGQNFVAQGGESIANGRHIAEANEVIMYPGIYQEITINNGKAYLVPGIYIIRPSVSSNTNIVSLGGSQTTVIGDGVLIYNTGSNYNPLDGTPDIYDGSSFPPAPNNPTFGQVQINAGVLLSPINTAEINYSSTLYPGAVPVSSKFDGMLFFQRRLNESVLSVTGNASDGALKGTLYAKWTNVTVSGQGTYQAQFVVGTMTISGQGRITVLGAGQERGRANSVFLVE